MRRVALVSIALTFFAATMVVPLRAHALTEDFTTAGPAGRMTGSTATVGPVTAEAFYLNAGTYVNKDVAGATNTFLFIRNEPGDHGLGVCSPGQVGAPACGLPPFGGGGGDINELDNGVKAELIRLKIADGWDWQSVSVSSLDGGEKGELRWSNSDSLSQATVTGAAW